MAEFAAFNNTSTHYRRWPVWDGVDGKTKEERGDGIEEADMVGKPILKSFVRYPSSENAFRDDGWMY